VHAVGLDRNLPAKPRARVNAEILQRQRQQPGCHLLARGDDDVIFARVVQTRDLVGPVDELVGGAGHRRNHDGNLVAGVDLALDAPGDVLDPIDPGDRRAAEFLYDARHDENSPWAGRLPAKGRVYILFPARPGQGGVGTAPWTETARRRDA